MSQAEIVTYCSKENNPLGTFQYGTKPAKKSAGSGFRRTFIGKMFEGQDIVDLISGKDLDMACAYVSCPRGLTSLRDLLVPKRNPKDPLTFIWVFGTTGTGKSHAIHEFFQYRCRGSYYKPGANYKWWDGYFGQTCIYFEDFRLWKTTLVEFLEVTDIYANTRENKGGQIQINSPIIFLSCPFSPYDIRRQCTGKEDPAWSFEDLGQLHRRIDYVYNFDDPEDRISCLLWMCSHPGFDSSKRELPIIPGTLRPFKNIQWVDPDLSTLIDSNKTDTPQTSGPVDQEPVLHDEPSSSSSVDEPSWWYSTGAPLVPFDGQSFSPAAAPVGDCSAEEADGDDHPRRFNSLYDHEVNMSHLWYPGYNGSEDEGGCYSSSHSLEQQQQQHTPINSITSELVDIPPDLTQKNSNTRPARDLHCSEASLTHDSLSEAEPVANDEPIHTVYGTDDLFQEITPQEMALNRARGDQNYKNMVEGWKIKRDEEKYKLWRINNGMEPLDKKAPVVSVNMEQRYKDATKFGKTQIPLRSDKYDFKMDAREGISSLKGPPPKVKSLPCERKPRAKKILKGVGSVSVLRNFVTTPNTSSHGRSPNTTINQSLNSSFDMKTCVTRFPKRPYEITIVNETPVPSNTTTSVKLPPMVNKFPALPTHMNRYPDPVHPLADPVTGRLMKAPEKDTPQHRKLIGTIKSKMAEVKSHACPPIKKKTERLYVDLTLDDENESSVDSSCAKDTSSDPFMKPVYLPVEVKTERPDNKVSSKRKKKKTLSTTSEAKTSRSKTRNSKSKSSKRKKHSRSTKPTTSRKSTEKTDIGMQADMSKVVDDLDMYETRSSDSEPDSSDERFIDKDDSIFLKRGDYTASIADEMMSVSTDLGSVRTSDDDSS